MPDVELRGVEAAPAPPDAPNTAPTLARRDTQVAAALAELHRPARRL